MNCLSLKSLIQVSQSSNYLVFANGIFVIIEILLYCIVDWDTGLPKMLLLLRVLVGDALDLDLLPQLLR